jgi:hypothetical protein
MSTGVKSTVRLYGLEVERLTVDPERRLPTLPSMARYSITLGHKSFDLSVGQNVGCK